MPSEYRKVLLEIGNGLGKGDVKKLVFLFLDQVDDKQVLEACEKDSDGFKLIQQLENQCIIEEDNCEELIDALIDIGKQTLAKTLIDYTAKTAEGASTADPEIRKQIKLQRGLSPSKRQKSCASVPASPHQIDHQYPNYRRIQSSPGSIEQSSRAASAGVDQTVPKIIDEEQDNYGNIRQHSDTDKHQTSPKVIDGDPENKLHNSDTDVHQTVPKQIDGELAHRGNRLMHSYSFPDAGSSTPLKTLQTPLGSQVQDYGSSLYDTQTQQQQGPATIMSAPNKDDIPDIQQLSLDDHQPIQFDITSDLPQNDLQSDAPKTPKVPPGFPAATRPKDPNHSANLSVGYCSSSHEPGLNFELSQQGMFENLSLVNPCNQAAESFLIPHMGISSTGQAGMSWEPHVFSSQHLNQYSSELTNLVASKMRAAPNRQTVTPPDTSNTVAAVYSRQDTSNTVAAVYSRQDTSNTVAAVYSRQDTPHLGENKNTIRKFCYDKAAEPKAITLYKYQKELASIAKTCENSIICAPTGSGKTLTAAHITRYIYNRCKQYNNRFKCVFIVPIRSLITQQCEEFRTLFGDNEVQAIQPITDAKRLQQMIENHNVVFLTAQILVNALHEEVITITDFDMIIFDECHHTDLEHPFNNIMRKYLEGKRYGEQNLPQILGLTASLGVGKGKPVDHYIKLCANLDCTQIAHVKENMEELLKQNPKPTVQQIRSVNSYRMMEKFAFAVQKIMTAIEGDTSVEFPKLGSALQRKGTPAYENMMVENRQQAEKFGQLRDTMAACIILRLLNDSLMLFADYRATDAVKYLDEKLDPGFCTTAAEIRFNGYYLKNQPELCQLSRSDANPMLQELFLLLKKLFTDKPHSKGLLLTRTRLGTECLFSMLKDKKQIPASLHEILLCDRLVGHGKEQFGGMTDEHQKTTIEGFKNGLINLLIATDVAQEGLDIPRCNFVIRYNFVSNEIGAVQSKGRARAMESEVYLIVPKGSTNERRELENLTKEHSMMEALLEIDKIDQQELMQKIQEKQDALFKRHENKLKSIRAIKTEPANSVMIVCKECKSFLCVADSIRKKGGAYICVDEEYANRVEIRKYSPSKIKKQTFATDCHIGNSICKECTKSIGPVLRYTNSARIQGFTMGKENIMYYKPGDEGYTHVKKWPSVLFTIKEEKIED